MNKRIYLDTNVLIDFIGERIPFNQDIVQIISAKDKLGLQFVVSTLSFSTAHYVTSKFGKSLEIIEVLKQVKFLFETVDFSNEILEKGLNSTFSDFEDSLHFYTALKNNCDLILTRNPKDFSLSTITIMTPHEYLELLKTENRN